MTVGTSALGRTANYEGCRIAVIPTSARGHFLPFRINRKFPLEIGRIESGENRVAEVMRPLGTITWI